MCTDTARYDFRKHPWIGRFNSWLLAKFEEAIHEETGPIKQRLMAGLSGTVAEVGPGNGINFRYYPAGVKVLAVEPNPYMHERLRDHARRFGVNMELVADTADAMPLADDSIDAVVCTLVLCTVPDPDAVLVEIRRVLRPGGRFIFMEHVAAERGTFQRRVQNVLHRPWRWLFEGCHTNRETAALLERAGFSSVELARMRAKSLPPVITPMIYGSAQK